MSNWTWLWIGWGGYFLAVEIPALLNKQPGDTLSEHVWAWFAISRKGTAWRLRRFMLLAFLAWLTLHFLTGGKF